MIVGVPGVFFGKVKSVRPKSVSVSPCDITGCPGQPPKSCTTSENTRSSLEELHRELSGDFAGLLRAMLLLVLKSCLSSRLVFGDQGQFLRIWMSTLVPTTFAKIIKSLFFWVWVKLIGPTSVSVSANEILGCPEKPYQTSGCRNGDYWILWKSPKDHGNIFVITSGLGCSFAEVSQNNIPDRFGYVVQTPSTLPSTLKLQYTPINV